MSGTITLAGGKQYTKVVSRLKDFRSNFPAQDSWKIITEIVNLSENGVVFKASIVNPEDKIVATGHGHNGLGEDKSLEKAETVALGRCMAMFDPVFGGDAELASFDEMDKSGFVPKAETTELSKEINQIKSSLKVANTDSSKSNKVGNTSTPPNGDTSSSIMPFGKHKGEYVGDVPGSYLEWVLNNMQIEDKLKGAISAELLSRDQGTDDELPF